jgi:hypothetical protein
MKKKLLAVLVNGFLLTGLAGTSMATTIASDNFQSYEIGELAGKNGGTGWAGAWATTNPVVVSVIDPAIDLQGNRAIAFTGNNNTAASRLLSTTLSGDVFVDFQIQFNGTVNNNDFLGLWFGAGPGNTTSNPNIGLKGNNGDGTGSEDFFVRTTNTSGSFLSGSNISNGTTYHVFGHLYKSQGNNQYNHFDAWLNPTDAEMSSLTGIDASFTGNSGISSFNQIGFRTANLNGDTVLIDNLNIRNSAPVPEPGTMMLLGFGLFGLAVYGKRRANKNEA